MSSLTLTPGAKNRKKEKINQKVEKEKEMRRN